MLKHRNVQYIYVMSEALYDTSTAVLQRRAAIYACCVVQALLHARLHVPAVYCLSTAR
jgi:hypothetical protein